MAIKPLLSPLIKRQDFVKIYKEGVSTARKGFIMQLAWQDRSSPKSAPQGHKYYPNSHRFGLTASKKIGNAVTRNRAKRRLRALVKTEFANHPRIISLNKENAQHDLAQYDLAPHHVPQYNLQHNLQCLDIVLVARQDTTTYSWHNLTQDFHNALNQLLKKLQLLKKP